MLGLRVKGFAEVQAAKVMAAMKKTGRSLQIFIQMLTLDLKYLIYWMSSLCNLYEYDAAEICGMPQNNNGLARGESRVVRLDSLIGKKTQD